MLLSDFGIDERYFAHTCIDKEPETLIEHLDLTLEYYKKIIESKNLNFVIDSLIKKIDSKNFELIKEMFINTIYLHDLGKKNPIFQKVKMKNPLFGSCEDEGDSKHSHIGALEFIAYYNNRFNKEIKNDVDFYRLNFILYTFSYHISKHHGKLDNMNDYPKDKKENKKKHNDFTSILKNIDDYVTKDDFDFFILNKLLFSLVISSDYFATTAYMTDKTFDNFGIFQKKDKLLFESLYSNFMKSFGEPKGINKLRNEISKTAVEELSKNINKSIFYLEAPTGSGKTLTSISLASKLLNTNENLNKIFYIFPFNTLVEQTKKVFENIFKDKFNMEVINSVTPIKEINDDENEKEETNYDKSYLNRLFFNEQIIFTTHIKFFDILFGTTKDENFPLWQLANSVIIIDEIQSYNNNLWWYMTQFFEKYASLLNMKIIIMSATLPKLDFFLEKKDNFVSLIPDEKRDEIFGNKYFKDRVSIKYLDLDNKITFEKLYDIFKEENKKYKKVLFEFIKKDTARKFYQFLKEKKVKNLYELSGDDNKAFREYVINKTKNNEEIVIVATQVIEAGIDIDMDLGFKDISTLDSEEQFLGRINRSCLKSEINPTVYFFYMDDANKIYKNDNRLEFDLRIKNYQEILLNKNFAKYYENVLTLIKDKGLKYEDGYLTNYGRFEKDVKYLNYKKIQDNMKLIKSSQFTLYFPFQINLSIYKDVKEFIGLDEIFLTDGKLDGQKVWDEFIALNKIESFTKREIEKSKINSLMQFFTFNIFKYYDGQRPHIGEEMYGYYFIDNLEYITSECKFDREKFNNDKKSLFL
ncbi:CRISPR-associated helicase Cas3' [Aliarcobacter vitoriensis]|uniref:CRISPR-associated helicase Cas3' n=1 Tax=Aliarcobacter vitoriensis TaxID=2011099 RepID=UPI003AAB7084